MSCKPVLTFPLLLAAALGIDGGLMMMRLPLRAQQPANASTTKASQGSAQQLAQQQRATARAERLDELEARIARLEAVRAIERVQYAYGHYVEFGLWNDFADLFMDNADTNYAQGAHNKEAVRKLFFDQVGQGHLGLSDGRVYPHILYQPVITLSPDGRSAKGRWRILAMLGGLNGSATWYSGVYENEYALDNGVWKISYLRSEPKATAAYTAMGWKDSGVHLPFHYDVANVGERPLAVGAARSSAVPNEEALAARALALDQRAQRLTDQGAVTNLLDSYGYAFDRKQWDQVAALFDKGGTLELGQQGVYAGPASIRRGLNQFGSKGLAKAEVNDHVYLQTLVTVGADGLTAQARGVELIFASADGGELREGVFEDAFTKVNGTWKIQSVHFYPRMIVDAAKGWAKSAKPAPGPSAEFPPDRPPTAKYEIYPKFTVAPFHFNNPVTGKAPQYPEGVVAWPAKAVPEHPARPAARRGGTDLEARMTLLERNVTAAEAWEAAESLLDAYGYSMDEAPQDVGKLFAPGAARQTDKPASGRTVFVNQMLQPVIEVAKDGKSANVRARRLDLGGVSGGAGDWSSGTVEGRVIISKDGGWKWETLRSSHAWTAAYPGGWSQ